MHSRLPSNLKIMLSKLIYIIMSAFSHVIIVIRYYFRWMISHSFLIMSNLAAYYYKDIETWIYKVKREVVFGNKCIILLCGVDTCSQYYVRSEKFGEGGSEKKRLSAKIIAPVSISKKAI